MRTEHDTPQNAPAIVHCPICKKPVVWDESHPWRPFCSRRCKLIDLGAWASDAYGYEDKTIPPGKLEDC